MYTHLKIYWDSGRNNRFKLTVQTLDLTSQTIYIQSAIFNALVDPKILYILYIYIGENEDN